jgi:hypothetical protein
MDFMMMNMAGVEEDGEPRGKVRAVAAPEDKELKGLLILVAKLALSSALASRVLKSVLIRVFLINAASEYIVKGRETTLKYADTASKVSRANKDKMGQPHHWLWNSFIKVATAMAVEDTHKKQLADYKKYMEEGGVAPGMKKLVKEVRYFRICKAFNQDSKKIEVSMMEGSKSMEIFDNVIIPLMIKEGKADEKEGVAPPGDLERKIQAVLDDLPK